VSDSAESSERPTRAARLAGFAVLGALGLYALYVAIDLGLWRGRSPGEGLFPFITAVGMIAFSASGLAVVMRQPHEVAAAAERPHIARMSFYVAVLLFYALALQSLGFIVATIVSVAAILRFAERYSWASTLIIAIGAAAACHVLFGLWLGAILPSGTIWEWITG
jgi:hypothetical protein